MPKHKDTTCMVDRYRTPAINQPRPGNWLLQRKRLRILGEPGIVHRRVGRRMGDLPRSIPYHVDRSIRIHGELRAPYASDTNGAVGNVVDSQRLGKGGSPGSVAVKQIAALGIAPVVDQMHALHVIHDKLPVLQALELVVT